MLYNVIQPKVAHTQLTHNTWKTVDDTRVSPTCLRCRKARRILPENVFGGQHSTEELEHFSHAEFCYMLPAFARNLSFLRPHRRHGSHCYSRGVLQNYRRTVWIDVIDESFPHRLVVHRSLRIAASEALVLQKKNIQAERFSVPRFARSTAQRGSCQNVTRGHTVVPYPRNHARSKRASSLPLSGWSRETQTQTSLAAPPFLPRSRM